MTRIRTLTHRVLLAAAVLVTAGITGNAEAAAPIEAILRDKAVVSNETVTLGDLFINAGEQAGALVSRAPAPGERAAIKAAHVANAARAAGMLWPNRERYTHIIVNRDGTRVGAETVRNAIELSIATREAATTPAGVSYTITLDTDPASLFVAKGAAPEAIVKDLSYDVRSGLFTALVATPARGAKVERLTGRATRTRQIPVAAAAIARDEIIREDMLTLVDMDVARIAPGTALDIADLVGMTSRTALRTSQPIRTADMRLPVTVAKDAQVTITYELPGMVLTATGRALENAPMNGLVRVINTRSHRTVHARVVGPDRVVIESGQPLHVAGRAIH